MTSARPPEAKRNHFDLCRRVAVHQRENDCAIDLIVDGNPPAFRIAIVRTVIRIVHVDAVRPLQAHPDWHRIRVIDDDIYRARKRVDTDPVDELLFRPVKLGECRPHADAGCEPADKLLALHQAARTSTSIRPMPSQ